MATGGSPRCGTTLVANPQLDPFLRALHAMFQRRYAAAIEILSKALVTETDRNTHNIEKLLLGLSQQRAGDFAAARATYEEAAQDYQRQLEERRRILLLRAKRMPFWAALMQVWAKRPLPLRKDKKLWPCIPLPKIQSRAPTKRIHGGYLRSPGGCRPRDSHSQATAADPVMPCDYSGAAATRSGLGSNPQRSSLSGIGHGEETVNIKNFFAK